jgi:hypothetical protein
MVCTNCGMTLRQAMVWALLEDAGCKVYPSALYCGEGREHAFAEPAALPVAESVTANG